MCDSRGWWVSSPQVIRRGFTLVEALVCLSIIGLLLALLIPAVQSAREAARRIQCAANLKQLGIALHGYHNPYGSLPSGQEMSLSQSSNWVKILPYLEQTALYHAVNHQVSIYHAANLTIQTTRLSVLMCPSDHGATVREANSHIFAKVGGGDPAGRYQCFFTSYMGSFGSMDTRARILPDQRGLARGDGVLNETSPMPFSAVSDGLSNTLLAAERSTAYLLELSEINPVIARTCGCFFSTSMYDTVFTAFYPPNMPRKVAMSAGLDHSTAALSLHPSGINALICDGSVRRIRDSISTWAFDPQTGRPLGAIEGPGAHWENLPRSGIWQALATRAGAEIESE
jgi:prepilin-type N-terminal cleavage/methylation domain-containing protein